MSQDHASAWDTLGAILLMLWCVAMWAAVAVLAYANRRAVSTRIYWAAAGVIGIGIVGQLGHVQEHFAQIGYWVANPNEKAWMTPWGNSLARGIGQVDTSKPPLGMEILHLAGNFIFLAGLVGVMVITRRARNTRSRSWGRMGVWMQGIHGVEHLALTLTVAFGASQAVGLSTIFGLLDPGPGLWTYRVWWHFIANVMGTIIFMMAVYHLCRERKLIEESFQPAPEGVSAPVDTVRAAGHAPANS